MSVRLKVGKACLAAKPVLGPGECRAAERVRAYENSPALVVATAVVSTGVQDVPHSIGTPLPSDSPSCISGTPARPTSRPRRPGGDRASRDAQVWRRSTRAEEASQREPRVPALRRRHTGPACLRYGFLGHWLILAARLWRGLLLTTVRFGRFSMTLRIPLWRRESQATVAISSVP